jgi:hypothetical protein
MYPFPTTCFVVFSILMWHIRSPWSVDPRIIAKHLKDAGYEVWLDVNNINAGGNLKEQLASALHSGRFRTFHEGLPFCLKTFLRYPCVPAAAVLACISDEYVQSTNCREEFSFSRLHNIPIIPLLVGDPKRTEWTKTGIGLQVAHEIYIDFREVLMK